MERVGVSAVEGKGLDKEPQGKGVLSSPMYRPETNILAVVSHRESDLSSDACAPRDSRKCRVSYKGSAVRP